jgi:sugar/nucleoside kinase (ribokinase family)
VIFAMETAKESGVKISIDLADPALIFRIPDVILNIVKDYSDIVFVNELEAKAFTGKEEEEALEIISSMCDIAVVKLGGRGSLIRKAAEIHRIAPNMIEVVNTNGAGDMYAAGLLYGLSRDLPLDRAGRIASYAASLVVAQVSTRLIRKIDIDSII